MKKSKILRIILIVFLSLAVLYTAFGFLVLPKIVKSQLTSRISEFTQSNVELRDVDTNPLFLTASLKDFKLSRENNEIISFKDLLINFSISSIVKRSLNFSEIKLTEPFINLQISSEGKLNLLDLAPKSEDKEDKKEKKDDGIFPLLIKEITFDRGNILFQDFSNKTPYRSDIKALSFTLKNLSTIPNEEGVYELDANLNENGIINWNGTLELNPVRSEGTIKFDKINTHNIWEYIQDRVNFIVKEGSLDINAEYSLDFSGDEREFRFKNSEMSLTALSILAKESNEEVVSIPSLLVSGIDFDIQKKKLDISKVDTSNGNVFAKIDEDGVINFKKLVNNKNPEKIEDSDSNKKVEKIDNKKPKIDLNIGEIGVSGYNVNFEDNSLSNKTQIKLGPTNINIKNFSLVKSESPLTVDTVLNEAGKININGVINTPGFTSDLKLDFSKIPLNPFEPYIDEFAEIDVEGGNLSLTGDLINQFEQDKRNIKFNGNLNVDSTMIKQAGNKDDLFRWADLRVAEAEFDLIARSLSIKKIDVDKLYSNVVIDVNGKVNLKSIVKSDTDKVKKEEKIESKKTDKPDNKKDKFVTEIGKVNLSDGELYFSDLSLEPVFKTNIQELEVTLTGLSSKDLKTAKIDLKGKIDKYAPVKITGEVNPLGDKTQTDIDVNIEGVELTNLSSYSGKYVGYRMGRGKLSLDLEYVLNEKLLDGKNKIVFDQIKLGDKVQSPDAKDLPLELAISLLKDRSGAVKLDFPVSGDPTDPKFNVSEIIFKTFFNLIFKAVTSPFSILGSVVGIFGGGEELSYVSFEPGSSKVTDKEKKELGELLKALSERPNLKLDIKGVAYNEIDRLGLAEMQIINSVRDDDEQNSDKPLTEDEMEDILEIYENDYGVDPLDKVPEEDANGKDIPKAEKIRIAYNNSIGQLKDFETVKDSEMIDLAKRRADSIRDFLTNKEMIDQSRIFTLDPSIESAESAEGVRVPLGLDTF